MKRTAVLIGVLILSALGLLIYAVTATPQKKFPGTLKEVNQPSNPAAQKSVAESVLGLNPEQATMTASGTAVFEMTISTGSNQVTGVQLELAYDPKAITDITVKPGAFLPTPNILLNTIDKVNGRLSYALVLPPSQPPVKGSGTVAVLTVKKNPAYTDASSTTLLILQKSLVSALGVDGSVLRDVHNATINFPAVTPATATGAANTGTVSVKP